MQSTAFFAYPAGSATVTEAITAAVELSTEGPLHLKPWVRMKIIGFKVDDRVRDQISESAALLADVTIPNPNVFYEIGFAIALGKPVIPTVNSAIDKAIAQITQIGLFDTIGWIQYQNGRELIEKLKDWSPSYWTTNYVRPKDHSQPLYVLDTAIKTEFRNAIFSAIENSGVEYRSFDPDQTARLTAAQAIAEVSSSAGVIVPILQTNIVGHELNNIRAAFILGLSHGYGIEALGIQYDNGPVPLDYRDFVRNSTYSHETQKHVGEYSGKVLIWNQNRFGRRSQAELGLLTEIDLGSPTAESETQTLPDYFVKTAAYSKALRSEGAVVIGRKGSGKSAIYLQISDEISRQKHSCIVDLRPASHNLSELREALISVSSEGVFDHTIAAFWQYIIYVEIVLRLRQAALPASRNDFALQERIRTVEDAFNLNDSIVSGNFTVRLEAAVNSVINALKNMEGQSDLKKRITNAMFEDPIPRLRDTVVEFSDFATEIVLLIDDLDKGWPPRQVESHDVSTVKHLLEMLTRIRRDLGKRDISFRHLLFLRSDMYERLVDETSDRGKYNPVKIDWSDPEQLTYLLKQRVISNIDINNHENAWALIDIPPYDNREGAVMRMINGSLRRPRFLIDICERTLSFAINRGHTHITSDDVEEGLRQMSLYLVSDFGYEMRDIAGTPENIFYAFIGKSDLLTRSELHAILSDDRLDLRRDLDDIIEVLLWYSFLGIAGADGAPIYIYNREYDFRRLQAERDSLKDDLLYVVNQAFLRGLKQ